MNSLYGGHVVDTLYVGGIMAIKELPKVTNTEEKGKVVVITLLEQARATAFCESLLREVQAVAPSLDLDHHVWSIKDRIDSEFLTDELASMVQHIDEALCLGRVCLVHCAQGISRSVSVCASYLICKRNMSFYQAMTTIRQGRPIANPNLGFVACLRSLEQCKGDITLARQRLQPKDDA